MRQRDVAVRAADDVAARGTLDMCAVSAPIQQQNHLAEAARHSEAARQLAERQYNAGLANFITVLETQRQSFTAQIDLLTVRRRRLDARVNLHLALGGGFDLTREWSEFLEQSNPRTLDAGGSQ